MSSMSDIIICDSCGKCQERNKAFFMFEFKCCSNECMEPLRKKKQTDLIMKISRKGQSAFTHFGQGGY